MLRAFFHTEKKFLFIIPVAVLLLNIFFMRNEGKFYMGWPDPCYAYMMNGLNIANGRMEVGHTDHPGTTVQTIGGILERAIYICTGTKANISEDVISDPEKYVHILSFIAVLLNVLVISYAGFVVLRVSGKLSTALYFQSGALVFYNALIFMPDFKPEPFLMAAILLFIILCFRFLHEPFIDRKKRIVYSLKFAALFAFLLVSKITTAPLLIIPVLLISNLEGWAVFFSGMTVLICLLLIPAWTRIHLFFEWIQKVAFHSGIYGAGEERIIDPGLFRINMGKIFNDDYLFGCIAMLMFCALIAAVLNRKKTARWKNNANLRLLAGIFIATVASMAMVAKHFSYHYLVPAYGLSLMGAYVALPFVFSREKFPAFFRGKNIFRAVVIFVSIYFFIDVWRYPFYNQLTNPRVATARVMQSQYAGVPRIYAYFDFPFPEVPPALFFGMSYSGDMKTTYIPILKKYYPHAYFFSAGDLQFRDWGSTIELADLLRSNPKLLLCFYEDDETVIGPTLDAVQQLNAGGELVQVKKVFVNPITGGQLYELDRTGNVQALFDSTTVYSCDAETAVDNKVIGADGKTIFYGFEGRTQEQAHSGKYSLKLSPANDYGFTIHLPVNKGKYYEISAWRKSDCGKGVIAASSSDGSFYRSDFSVNENGENGWGKIRLLFKVPENYSDSTITIDAWNEGGDHVSYFDDMKIVVYH